MKSVLRFPAIIIAFSTSILCAESEDRILTSIENLSGYYPMLPELVNPFPPQNKTLCLKSTHPFWNGHFLKPTKKLRKIKKDDEAGLIDETFVLYHRWEDFDLQIPAIVTVDWYKPRALKANEYEEFKKGYIKKLTKKTSGSGGRGKGISLINTQIGETDVELNISGNISVNGALVFENKDLVTTNIRESKSWDLEIEQTQRFSIDGNIGDRFFVKIKQDSEADFTWENDLTIEYRGHKNDILQKAEAGNINLSLEGMESVNLGGANSSLFGLKAVHQLGPVEIQSVIAREQVKKSEKSMEGGAEAGAPTNINEYNFINDRYFFIDDRFKRNYYPITETNNHIYDSVYVIGKYEVFQKVTTAENDIIQANAYLDPGDSSSYSVGGTWVRLEENMDYEIERLLGYIRLNSVQNAIAIAYSTTFFNQESQTFGTVQDTINGTNFKSVYDACKADNPENYQEVCEGLITLKLLKDINPSTPNSPTWPLMFKNVYSLGGSNIDPSGLEIEIIRDLGGGDERTHTDGGESYLSVFGLDSEDENHQKVEGGDGKVDLYGSFLNLAYGELMIPAHLPFSFDETPRTDHSGNPVLAPDSSSTFWGLNEPQLQGILENELIDADGDFADETDTGPAMYFDTNQDKKNEEHEFIIRVKTSTRSSSMSLGFMIVEGSETVRLGGEVLQKDVDYTIDYFSGTINFINPQALDPTAEISVSYEENELISFDQKLLVGSHLKYGFGERNYLAGGMFYYNQSIADEKVDIGYEPMRNFVWNIKGKYQNELGFITRAVDYLPLIETTKPSVFSIEGDYAQINPNPNPLGQAFIDDFESAKRTSSFSLMMRQWKMASAPLDSSLAIQNRSRMIWYNPYEDELTKNIWPEQSTSTRANNNTTKTMIVETRFSGDPGDSTFWNGLMIPLYVSEHDQSLSKYMDVWLNTESVTDDSFKIHFDIGHISEDRNGNSILDTEDEPVYGPGMGDGILSDGEDMGVDNCTDSFEDGWGGCLCSNYDPARYDSDLNGIYAHQDEFCLDTIKYTYDMVLNSLDTIVVDGDTLTVNLNVPYDDNNNRKDPNGDNWCYNTTGCSNTSDYSRTNGTEGNGQAMGYRYPDSEDLDKNNTLDTRNEYFTFTLSPKLSSDDPESMVVAETEAEGTKTGWKLIRIPMLAFSEEGTPDWNDVPTFRIRFESESTDLQTIKIAKIELVENDWQEMGVAQKDTLGVFTEDPVFSVEVINTDESTDYKSSLDNLDIILEHDEYNDVDMKEQALVLSFLANPDFNSNDPESAEGGIESEHAALIKNTFPSLGDKANSYFAYEKMEMFIHGGDPAGDPVCPYCDTDSSEVEFLFRMGKDDRNYYEIRQPIYEGWDDKNHLDISIDKLTQLKIPTIESPAEKLLDAGFDGFTSIGMNLENGCVGADETPFGGGFESMGYEIVLDS
ncbi:MAG: cell surface protein SprA, partial [Candidatus Marinimicrobia bacterium]|nr:cell surface protein SprA [Candidatus Neomarinimicrobiota bacterium]